jgi:Domain of unknown function (DUF222)
MAIEVDSATSEGARLALELVALRQQIDRLERRFSQLAAAFAQTEFWDDEGSNSAIDWMRFNCRMTSTAAADRVAVGNRLADLGQSCQAMEAGEIGFAHLTVMARTANAVGQAFDEGKLLELARENSPGKFFYKSMHYRHAVDARAYNREQAELVEKRALRLNTAEDGCLLISGILDPAGGALVRVALEPLARPSGAHDDRQVEQRFADALVELASKGGRRQYVQMQVTASIETLLGLVGAPGAETDFTLPVSAATVQRWACDCSLTRVLMQDSVVIDVGRAERVIKGPRRRALIARDGHCQWTGCERPASWCDGHHLVHWTHGGGGEIENQVLLCGRHHWKVHEGGWQLIKTDDGRILPVAPTITFGEPRLSIKEEPDP